MLTSPPQVPRSLNSRCHGTSSLETLLLPSAQWWCSVANTNSFPLKNSSETSAPETPQHLLAASKTPFTCRQGERWSRKNDFQETAGASKPGDKKEKWGWPDSWHWPFGYSPDGWATPMPVAMVRCSTPPLSIPDQISHLWHAAGTNAFSLSSPMGDTATAKEESEAQDEAISLWTHETRKVCLYFHCN